jgi:N-acyl-D-aspartate/D-glutamate deacylase
MLPHAGQGAAQALEDAVALGLALGAEIEPQAGLRRYEAVRARRTARVVRLARRLAWVRTTNSPVVAALRGAAIRWGPLAALHLTRLYRPSAPHAALRQAARSTVARDVEPRAARGVELLAGTDAMGLPMIIPGRSLIRELELLNRSGLSPYEAIRTATVNPAKFLGRDREFGTLAPSRRADLLLLDHNPLESLSALDRPAGVMVRGRWLPRDRLEEMLSALR